MRVLRAFAGSLLAVLAGLLGLVGVLLCATLVLLPLGIPVLMLARKLFGYAMAAVVPRKVRHPVDELGRSARSGLDDAKDSLGAAKPRAKKLRKAAGKTSKKASDAAGDKAGSLFGRRRKGLL